MGSSSDFWWWVIWEILISMERTSRTKFSGCAYVVVAAFCFLVIVGAAVSSFLGLIFGLYDVKGRIEEKVRVVQQASVSVMNAFPSNSREQINSLDRAVGELRIEASNKRFRRFAGWLRQSDLLEFKYLAEDLMVLARDLKDTLNDCPHLNLSEQHADLLKVASEMEVAALELGALGRSVAVGDALEAPSGKEPSDEPSEFYLYSNDSLILITALATVVGALAALVSAIAAVARRR